MINFELSILPPEGVEYKNWKPVQDDILAELLRAEYILYNADECGAKLGEILSDDSLTVLAANLTTKDSMESLREIILKDMGYANVFAMVTFLSRLMLVGNGECPFCGSPNYHEPPTTYNWDFDNTEKMAMEWESSPTKVCDNCGYEWCTEE